jgi:hypothetical protein
MSQGQGSGASGGGMNRVSTAAPAMLSRWTAQVRSQVNPRNHPAHQLSDQFFDKLGSVPFGSPIARVRLTGNQE